MVKLEVQVKLVGIWLSTEVLLHSSRHVASLGHVTFMPLSEGIYTIRQF